MFKNITKKSNTIIIGTKGLLDNRSRTFFFKSNNAHIPMPFTWIATIVVGTLVGSGFVLNKTVKYFNHK